MTFDEADSLLKEILVFLNKQGGSYRQITNVGKLQEVILTALSTGRFFYDRKSFVCWEWLDECLFVHEAAGDFKTIRRVLRPLKKQASSMAWFREKKGRGIYTERCKHE